MRGATYRGQELENIRIISIHAPREGSDETPGHPVPHHHAFLSTLPVRGATGPETGVEASN